MKKKVLIYSSIFIILIAIMASIGGKMRDQNEILAKECLAQKGIQYEHMWELRPKIFGYSIGNDSCILELPCKITCD